MLLDDEIRALLRLVPREYHSFREWFSKCEKLGLISKREARRYSCLTFSYLTHLEFEAAYPSRLFQYEGKPF